MNTLPTQPAYTLAEFHRAALFTRALGAAWRYRNPEANAHVAALGYAPQSNAFLAGVALVDQRKGVV